MKYYQNVAYPLQDHSLQILREYLRYVIRIFYVYVYESFKKTTMLTSEVTTAHVRI